MNKISIFRIAFFLFIALGLSAEEPLESLADDVDNYWINSNESALLQLISDRISNDPNDVFALSLKSKYHIYVDVDLNKARAAIDTLHAYIATLGDESLTLYVDSLKAKVYAIPLSESFPLSQSEKNELLAFFDDGFPGVEESVQLANRVSALLQE
jgi:hypothetical protein